MWIARERLESVARTLLEGRAGRAALLAEILKSSSVASVPSRCPRCAASLTEGTLPRLAIPVRACPAGHGVWIGPKAAASLRGLLAG